MIKPSFVIDSDFKIRCLNGHRIFCFYEETSVKDLSELIEHAVRAKQLAYCPFSKFPVGAALLSGSGRIYTGCNIESSSYGLTMCAERIALYKAKSEGETEFTALAIASDTRAFCPPCGACRQVLWDFCRDIKIVLVSREKSSKIYNLKELLPNAFDEGFLTDDA
jgi:cytidine deaminase